MLMQQVDSEATTTSCNNKYEQLAKIFNSNIIQHFAAEMKQKQSKYTHTYI